VNKSDLVNRVSESIDGGRTAASRAVEAVIETIQEAVSRGEKVAISGFGVFEKVERAARVGRNPATGEAVHVSASAVPKFRPGAEFKGYVSGARELVSGAVTTAVVAVEVARSSATKSVKGAAASITPSRARPAKKASAKTTAAKTAPVKKSAAKPATAKKAAAKAAPAAKVSAKKAPAVAKKSAPAKKAASAVKVAAKKVAPAKKVAAKAATTAVKSAPAKAVAAKATATKATATKATKSVAKKAPAKRSS
jgi:DNA-binding protein HU-beta